MLNINYENSEQIWLVAIIQFFNTCTDIGLRNFQHCPITPSTRSMHVPLIVNSGGINGIYCNQKLTVILSEKATCCKSSTKGL